MRWYQHLAAKASIELHHIACVTLDISVFIVRFGDRACACRVDTPMSYLRTNLPPFNKNFLGYLMNCLITMRQIMDYPYQRV